MILSNADMDFVQGFVKQACAAGVPEDQAATMLQIAWPLWKSGTQGQEALELLTKEAGGFTSNIVGAGKHLLGLGKTLAGAGYHGIKTPVMGTLGAISRNPGTTAAVAGAAAGAAGLGGVGYGAYKLWHNGDDKMDMNGFVPPNSGSPSGGQGSMGSGGGSNYSPNGSYIDDKIHDYDHAGAVDGLDNGVDRRPGSGSAGVQGGSQWNNVVNQSQGEWKQHRDNMARVRTKLNNLQASNMDPAARYKEEGALNKSLSMEEMSMKNVAERMGEQDTSLRNKQDQFNTADARNRAVVAQELPKAFNNADTWARRQGQARDASWWLPKAYYNTRNFLTGDTEDAGDQMSQRYQSVQAARDRINMQPSNYYH